MAPRLTVIASCVVVGLGASAAHSISSTSTYLAAPTRGNQALRNNQALRKNNAADDAVRTRQRFQGEANRLGGLHRSTVTRAPGPVRPAAILSVTNCNDAGPGSLRQAMSEAVDDDVIDLTSLTCGSILLESGPLVNHANVELAGPGRDLLAIDGNANGQVLVHYGESLTISGLTITNGSTSHGMGGCTWIDGDLEMYDSRVTGCVAGDGTNTAAYGAGLDVIGHLLLVNSIVSGNSATSTSEVGGSNAGAFGGGVYVGGVAYVMYGSEVAGNIAEVHGEKGAARGGGVFAQGGVGVAYGALIANNKVAAYQAGGSGYGITAYGGGVHSLGSSNAVLHSTISGNTAYSQTGWSYGGGINIGDEFGDTSGELVLFSSNISGNTTRADCGYCFIQGGGAHAFGSISAKYSTINDNAVLSAPDSEGVARGGGLSIFGPYYGEPATMGLSNSTISANRAVGGTGGTYGRGHGGGLMVQDGVFSILNSTLTLNVASHGEGGVSIDPRPQLYGEPDPEYVMFSTIVAGNEAPVDADIGSPAFTSVVVTGGQNLVQSAGGGVTLPPDTLDVDPQLLPLSMNGGSTPTHALPLGSPAIDAGSNPDDLDQDQRGGLFVREWGGAVDIGAFELQPDPTAIFKDGFEAQ